MGRAYYRKELCVLKRVRLDIKTLRQLSKPSQADVQGGYRGDAQGGYRGGRTGGLKDPPLGFCCVTIFPKNFTSSRKQEPITRSVQLPYIPVTAFSQTNLFLDLNLPRIPDSH